MQGTMTKKTEVYRVYKEQDATALVEEYKAKAVENGYTVLKTKIDYKTKKDRKSGEIVEEWWMVEVTVSYEV